MSTLLKFLEITSFQLQRNRGIKLDIIVFSKTTSNVTSEPWLHGSEIIPTANYRRHDFPWWSEGWMILLKNL